eukprot:g16807.t1
MGKLRPGSEMAMRLLDSDKALEWEAAFQSYGRSVERLSKEKGKSGLVALDSWVCTDLPEHLRSRAADGGKPYILKDELIKVVQWKLWIGAMRPSLLAYAKEQNAVKVQAKSREAFEHLLLHSSSSSSSMSSSPSSSVVRVPPDAVKMAVKALSADLRGVGPATASAVLCALCGGCPFDADEVIDAVKRTGKRDYSLKEYLEVHEALDAKASSLGAPWDAERCRKALWSRAMHSRFQMTVPPVESLPSQAPPTSSSFSSSSSAAASPPPGSSPGGRGVRKTARGGVAGGGGDGDGGGGGGGGRGKSLAADGLGGGRNLGQNGVFVT